MSSNFLLTPAWEDTGYLIGWIVAQWMPLLAMREGLLVHAWGHWEEQRQNWYGNHSNVLSSSSFRIQQRVPSLDVQKYKHNLSAHLEETYGKDWRTRPLLLRNLWSPSELADPRRRLSVPALLQENLTIPYFSDARLENALTPDAHGSVGSIVANMTKQGRPHKIGTQYLVQQYPELIQEIAPSSLLTELFGDYFTPDHVRGMMGGVLPALTTVPVFIASSRHSWASRQDEPPEQAAAATGASHRLATRGVKRGASSFTALHCEPIGNVAVQLAGARQWTMVDPFFSFFIRPSTAPDGRAFFASWKPIPTEMRTTTNDGNGHVKTSDEEDWMVPYYRATTQAGDAMWVPTWTWHRVDYVGQGKSNDNHDDEISIGGSLFHFRPRDFIANNPLFAMLILPAIFLELLGFKTQ